MQIQLDNGEHSVQIEAYQDGKLKINKKDYSLPLYLTPESIEQIRDCSQLRNLTQNHIDKIMANKPEVVLLGTGKTTRFLDENLNAYCISNHFVIDVMSTDAACRTFMLLAAEGRDVAALLL
ncbi:Mth938-like domain-containing protein [Pleionea sediminis]|uniref:Mth938-like domain-containing protein n=1 Tax=Pleionea sediminis TaxID=2569479 RepID=UPI001186A339|nr:MTH938/NDUFAF3 family protein [Pleionea sediminis]